MGFPSESDWRTGQRPEKQHFTGMDESFQPQIHTALSILAGYPCNKADKGNHHAQ
jgi:hypothetical protein